MDAALRQGSIDGNITRKTLLRAGIPAIGGNTIDRQCASRLHAITLERSCQQIPRRNFSVPVVGFVRPLLAGDRHQCGPAWYGHHLVHRIASCGPIIDQLCEGATWRHAIPTEETTLPHRASAVELQHLRYAVAAADHGKLRRAAELLLIRQSTLSRSIRQLEASIGATVFERSSGGVRATEAGRGFLRMARLVLEQMDTLLITAHSAGRGESGRLVIGFYTSLSAGESCGPRSSTTRNDSHRSILV